MSVYFAVTGSGSIFPDPAIMLKFLCSGGLYKAGVVEKSLVDVYVPFLPLERRHVLLCVRQEASKRYSFLHSVGDPDQEPDPRVFGPPGSGTGFISQRYGSFSHKCLERNEIMPAKQGFNTF